MKTLSKIFFTGLFTILPIAVTAYVVVWLAIESERLVSRGLHWLVPSAPEWPGVGIAAGVGVVLLTGLLMRDYVFRTLFGYGEAALRRIPLVKTLYGSLRDLTGFFANTDDAQKAQQVVMLTLGDSGARVLALLTREQFDDLPDGIGGDDQVAVYVPMSYQLGGFTLLVSRSAISPVDLNMEDAMRFAVTAGMSKLGTES